MSILLGIATTITREAAFLRLLIPFTVLSLFSIYDYAKWILETVDIDSIANQALEDIDPEYVREIIDLRESQASPVSDELFLKEIQINSSRDPLSVLTDIVGVSIDEADSTGAANYIQQVEEKFWEITEESDTISTYNDQKIMTTHFLSTVYKIHRLGRIEQDSRVVFETISTISNLVSISINKDIDGVSFESSRLFGKLSLQVYGDGDDEINSNIMSEYNSIRTAIIRKLQNTDAREPSLNIYLQCMRDFSVTAVDHRDYHRASQGAISLRRIIEVLIDSRDTFSKRAVTYLGQLGMKMADEEAIAWTDVEGAGFDTIVRNYPEEIISVHLVPIKEKCKEKGMTDAVSVIEGQIVKIESHLAEFDSEVHGKIMGRYGIENKTDLRLAWSFLRRHQGPFSHADMWYEITARKGSRPANLSLLIKSLHDLGVIKASQDFDRYSSMLNVWDPNSLDETEWDF
ncbi:hypothetical protein [Haloferax volcanii]|uniref:Uncharacterized protein n=1 Tax=Haloferax volcanii TaxID=2246 RepID=A0A558FU88_HALVO|nr:hypothetical protein [Haloferax volcanii]TVT89075.1 hypothetical protein FQA18_18690 [Haloferax volcanii]